MTDYISYPNVAGRVSDVEGTFLLARYPDSVRLYFRPGDLVDNMTVNDETDTRIQTFTKSNLSSWVQSGGAVDFVARAFRNIRIGDRSSIRQCIYSATDYEDMLYFLFVVFGELWATCEECGLLGCSGTEDHTFCDSCDAVLHHRTQSRSWRVYDENDNYTVASAPLCEPCGNHQIHRCGSCSYFYTDHYGGVVRLNLSREAWWCPDCRVASNVDTCADCGDLYAGRNLHEFEDSQYCLGCAREVFNLGIIEDWNYTPAYQFHPPIPTNPEKPLYIGIELEASLGYMEPDGIPAQAWIGGLDTDVVFVKSDSSVTNGFEAVSHPMEPRWALEHFPFEAFDKLIDLGAEATHRSTGTHVHMNKESFSSSHLWKLLQVHYRLPVFCTMVGGRTSDDWGSFTKNGMKTQRNRALRIAKAKGKEFEHIDRYVAVNLRPEHTIELRYMRGGIKPAEIKKNMEWALALYEFTSFITASDVTDGALNDPGFLWGWIRDNNYPNLQAWIQERQPAPRKLRSRT